VKHHMINCATLVFTLVISVLALLACAMWLNEFAP
jgi:hypothetical protein